MEENRPFMPPPPPHLRQKNEVKEAEKIVFAEEKDVKNANMTLEKEDVSFEKEAEMSVQQAQIFENFQSQNGDAFESTVSQEKKKLDWQSVINWTGLVVSVGFVVLFVFLLIK